jgi:hypothetical protein
MRTYGSVRGAARNGRPYRDNCHNNSNACSFQRTITSTSAADKGRGVQGWRLKRQNGTWKNS